MHIAALADDTTIAAGQYPAAPRFDGVSRNMLVYAQIAPDINGNLSLAPPFLSSLCLT